MSRHQKGLWMRISAIWEQRAHAKSIYANEPKPSSGRIALTGLKFVPTITVFS